LQQKLLDLITLGFAIPTLLDRQAIAGGGYQLEAGQFDSGSAGVPVGTFKRPAGTPALPGKPLCGRSAKCPSL